MQLNPPSAAALANEERTVGELIRREPGQARRVSELKLELGTTMDKHCAVFREEAGLQQALETV